MKENEELLWAKKDCEMKILAAVKEFEIATGLTVAGLEYYKTVRRILTKRNINIKTMEKC